jgi:hypothetical protein
MSDPKPMPRAAILAAAWIILLAAAAGFGLGVARDLKSRGGFDADAGEVVAPIKGVANAQPLAAAAVTEADVRRWTREEVNAQRAAAPKKAAPVVADSDDTDDTGAPAAPAPPPVVTPSNGNVVAPAKPQSAAPIPF